MQYHTPETQQFTEQTISRVVLCKAGAEDTKMTDSRSCCFSFFLSVSDSLSPSSCWRLATVTLGVFCLSSVVAAGVLAAKCKYGHGRETAITDRPDQVVFCFPGHKCIPCPENWLQYGEDCYYFSKEWKTWKESKAQCSALESRFLKIESKEELDFIMRSAQSYSSNTFWIGLSRNGTEGPWLWEDGSAFPPDLFQIQRASSSPSLDCVWLQGANIGAAWCGGYKFCICEKVVDPAAVEQVSYLDRH
uniref:C-type lectin domain-containing protein n=1 Tax=Calidris pygmaea TaxID=425635 RepID=A0A8C3J7C5_9CHAR